MSGGRNTHPRSPENAVLCTVRSRRDGTRWVLSSDSEAKQISSTYDIDMSLIVTPWSSTQSCLEGRPGTRT